MNLSIKTLVILLSLLISNPLLANKFTKLKTPKISAEDIKKLEAGQYLFKTQEIKNETWPIITMTQLVDATALESIAIFLALDYQKVYLPNIIESMPTKHISPVEVLAKYEMKMPWPVPNSKYVHGSILSKLEGGVYHAGWYMVESNAADKVDGNGWFIPHGDKTIFVYRSFVVPASFLAGLVKGTMLGDVKKSMLATKAHIEEVKQKKPAIMSKYKRYIVNSLAGQNVYDSVIKK